jgi:hypothetical protein
MALWISFFCSRFWTGVKVHFVPPVKSVWLALFIVGLRAIDAFGGCIIRTKFKETGHFLQGAYLTTYSGPHNVQHFSWLHGRICKRICKEVMLCTLPRGDSSKILLTRLTMYTYIQLIEFLGHLSTPPSLLIQNGIEDVSHQILGLREPSFQFTKLCTT